MKFWAKKWMLMGALALSVTSGLAACVRQAETTKAGVEPDKESAAMRTEVPLTRTIALDKAGEVVNLEFDLPPPGRNASPMLMLGFRTESPNAEAFYALSTQIFDADVAAKVSLLRVTEGAVAMVPLSRPTGEPGEWMSLPPDGTVPGVTFTSVDTTLLEEAGLLNATHFETYFKFAAAEQIVPGHYRLTIELMGDHPELEGQQAELVVAYFKRAK